MKHSVRLDGFLGEHATVILLLPWLDVQGDRICDLAASESLIDTLLGCLLSEALIDLGMHFVRVSAESHLLSLH